MTTSSTNTNLETPGLTLDRLLKVKTEIDALLSTLRYIASEYVPKLGDDGEPVVYVVPISDVTKELLGNPEPGETRLILCHPDNLEGFKRKARGRFRLVEWKPQEPTL